MRINHGSRRAVLRALPALAFASAAPAALAAPSEAASPLSELIADYHWRKAEFEELIKQHDRLDLALKRPKGCIVETWRVHTFDGLEERTEDLWSVEAIRARYRDPGLFDADYRRRRLEAGEVKIAELLAAKAERHRIEQEGGLFEAERRMEAAGWETQRARFAVFAYQPQTLADFTEQHAFARLIAADGGIDEEELDVLLGGDVATFAAYAARARRSHKNNFARVGAEFAA